MAEPKIRLTFPQAGLLRCLVDKDQHTASHYAPARRLVELGLAEWRIKGLTTRLVITDKGRAYFG